jgi:hypothetical protein
MNNYWHTNYKADQEGPVTFHYSILPHAAFSVVDAARFGTEQRQPLVVSLADTATPPRSALLHLSSPNVLVSSIKPIANGQSWLVYLYNPTEKIQRFGFLGNNGSPVSVRSSDAAGQITNPAQDFEIAAFGSAYVRIDPAAPDKAKP